VKKDYRPWMPSQSFLLPPSPSQWLPEGHLAYFVLEVVGELDIRAIEDVLQARDPRGTRPYAPRMMTALLLYAYCAGVFSSRKIERATYEDVAFRVITGDNHPDFTRINAFRLEHRDALAGLFVQVLTLCRRAGLSTVGHVSLDGTKIQANASKHKAMSYGRMKDEEKRLAAEIETLLFRADEVDAMEDERYGVGQRPEDLPEEFRRRDTRLKKIREAKAALEKEAAEARAAALRELAAGERHRARTALSARDRKQAAARAAAEEEQAQALAPRDGNHGNDDDDEPPSGGAASTELPHHRVPTTAAGEATDKAQRNFTDPDSRIMVRNGVFLQAYNAQAVVSETQVIVAHGVSNQPPDQEHLRPMLERTKANHGGEAPRVFSADSGYFSAENVAYCESQGIDAYIAVGRGQLELARIGKLPMTAAGDARWRMREKLVSDKGRRIYARRKVIPEPVFGAIKRAMGFARFSLRGLGKVGAEWGIVCTCHNLLKLFRALRPLRLALF
jgi:transposase